MCSSDLSKYYLDCDFSGVDCLQEGLKEAEEVKKLVNERCLEQFNKGLITLNDWRGQIGEAMIEESELSLASKLKWQMTDEELATVEKIFNSSITNNNQQQEDGKEQQPEQGSAVQG